MKERFAEYKLSFNASAIESLVYNKNKESKDKGNNGQAQAPGKPSEGDGFIPKKNWDSRKVKHRRGYGWPDKKGSVWIPTGPDGHGGPHSGCATS